MCKCTISLTAEMPPIYKVPVGIAYLVGTDEAKNIVTKNGDVNVIIFLNIMTRDRD
jgi:hypothetical protein